MNPFTIIVAIRDTDEEYEYILKSLKSAFALNPQEIIIGLDVPISNRILKRIEYIQNLHNNGAKVRTVIVKKIPDWNFHLAHLTLEMYKASSNDKMLHFDIDTVLRKEVMLGFDQIGKNQIAIISFTKRFRIKNLSELIRFIFYRLRVRMADYVFTGTYWMFKPYFFEVVDLTEYKNIRNGIDTYITEKIARQDKFKIITRKEIGAKMLGIANEEYDWRQFQDGIWFFANKDTLRERLIKETIERTGKRPMGILAKHPLIYILVKSFAFQRFEILRGYLWAKKNLTHPSILRAKGLTFTEWSYTGSKYIRGIKLFKDTGTGFE